MHRKLQCFAGLYCCCRCCHARGLSCCLSSCTLQLLRQAEVEVAGMLPELATAAPELHTLLSSTSHTMAASGLAALASWAERYDATAWMEDARQGRHAAAPQASDGAYAATMQGKDVNVELAGDLVTASMYLEFYRKEEGGDPIPEMDARTGGACSRVLTQLAAVQRDESLLAAHHAVGELLETVGRLTRDSKDPVFSSMYGQQRVSVCLFVYVLKGFSDGHAWVTLDISQALCRQRCIPHSSAQFSCA